MRLGIVAPCVFMSLLLADSQLMAGTACDSWPDSILCEDFDSFCNGFNDPCPGGAGTGSPAQLRNAWPKTSTDYYMNPKEVCGQDWMVEEYQPILNSAPFGGRLPNEGDESGSQLPQASHNLVPGIQAKFGSQNDVVLGTDAAPLELYFTISGGLKSASKLQGSNGYMELALEEEDRPRPGDLDPEVTPTDFVLVGVNHQSPTYPGCISCYRMCPAPDYSVSVPWPTVCQSYSARTAAPACPPVPANKIHKTLAIGALALLDNNPCHCETPANQMPQNPHLSYFDGWKWRILKSGLGGSGDFILGQKFDEVWFTVRTTTVEIRHRNTTWNGSAWENAESTITLPRLYGGAFNTLRAGTSSGCELKNDSYQCKQWAGTRCHRTGGERCDTGGYQPDAARYVSFDTVLLNGGTGNISPTTGACCLPDVAASCTMLSQSDCQAASGSWTTLGQPCEITTCCPLIFGDTDKDGFVDMDDFALLQRCMTIGGGSLASGCACLDYDGNGSVDGIDMEHFAGCAHGPGIVGNSDAPCRGVGW